MIGKKELLSIIDICMRKRFLRLGFKKIKTYFRSIDLKTFAETCSSKIKGHYGLCNLSCDFVLFYSCYCLTLSAYFLRGWFRSRIYSYIYISKLFNKESILSISQRLHAIRNPTYIHICQFISKLFLLECIY